MTCGSDDYRRYCDLEMEVLQNGLRGIIIYDRLYTASSPLRVRGIAILQSVAASKIVSTQSCSQTGDGGLR